MADTVPSVGALPEGAELGPVGSASPAPPERESRAASFEPRGPTPCLSDEEVLAFLSGGARRELIKRIDRHIDECVLCFELVRAATPEEALTGSQRFGGLALPVGGLAGGRYRVTRFVDRGGMGEVYEAQDLRLGERVALKTVLCTAGDSVKAIRKLFAELQLARRIAHRHVCRIYDLHEHRDPGSAGPPVPFLTMEFIEGETLSQRLALGPLRLDEVRTIARQLLLGLQAAHQAGVLHLDFKSDNVMLRSSADGVDAIIMDFGLARALDTQSRLRTSESSQLAGSVAYMAPEQVECQAILGEAADIYGFGVVLFEMLTGRLPFEGRSPAAVMLQRLQHAPPPPSSLRVEIPRALDEYVLACLSRDPERRCPDALSALAALDRLDFRVPEHGLPAPTRRRRPLRFVLPLLALLLASFAVRWASTRQAAHSEVPQHAVGAGDASPGRKPAPGAPPGGGQVADGAASALATTVAARLEPASAAHAPTVAPILHRRTERTPGGGPRRASALPGPRVARGNESGAARVSIPRSSWAPLDPAPTQDPRRSGSVPSGSLQLARPGGSRAVGSGGGPARTGRPVPSSSREPRLPGAPPRLR